MIFEGIGLWLRVGGVVLFKNNWIYGFKDGLSYVVFKGYEKVYE